MTQNRTFLSIFAVLTLFTALAGDALRYSISWYGFGAVAAFIAVISVILLVKQRDRWSFGRLPYPLLAFLVLAAVSTAWSDYPLWTALATVTSVVTVTSGVALAVTFTRTELLRFLGITLRLILGLSILFELLVSTILRAPLLPFWYGYKPGEKLPLLDYWSRDLFLAGGKIQGIVGNSSLLAFVALLGLIVFAIQLASRSVRLGWGIFWLAVAALNVLCTRSATITVGIVAVLAVLAAVLLLRRSRTPRGRAGVYWGMGGVVVVAAGIVALFHNQVLTILGKSDDLTGRLGIWEKVIHLAEQRPAVGWGWVSYWVPFISPFKDLVFRGGVRQLHAHNAWIDIWFQLGILGLVVFGALVLSTLVRAWTLAIDRPRLGLDTAGRYSAVSLLPLLVLVALLVQSAAESRLLVEYGLMLLTVWAVSTKQAQTETSSP